MNNNFLSLLINAACIIVITIVGLVISLFFPANAEAFDTICKSIMVVVGGHALIIGGTSTVHAVYAHKTTIAEIKNATKSGS